MDMMKSSNPALSGRAFDAVYAPASQARMTLDGTVNKTFVLLALALIPALLVWRQLFTAWETQSAVNVAAISGYMIVGAIGGLIVSLVTIFKKSWSPVTAPIYAVMEGLLLGGLSAITELQFKGIAIQATILTMTVALCMFLAYRTGMIRATEKFKLGVFAATAGIGIFYLIMMVLSFFGVMPAFFYGNGMLSIGISFVVVGIAALNLIMDFDLVEQGVKHGAPKYMEWYGAFALMVTLIWLYIEILRLLSKLRSRD